MTYSFNQIIHNPILFAATFLWIKDKDKNKIKLNYNPVQLDYLKNRSRFDIVLKPRQKGFSTMIQAEIFRKVITGRETALTLGVDDDNTQHLRRIFNYYYDNMPADFKPEKHFDNRTIINFPTMESEVIIKTAGSHSAGRGNTYSKIHGSEVAFWKNPEDLVAGAMQGGKPSIVLESTANGASGFFYERCMEAYESPEKSIWKLHFYRWFDDMEYSTPLPEGEYLVYDDDELELQALYNLSDEQLYWRRLKIAEIGKRNFTQEYPSDIESCFLSSGVSFFSDIANLRQLFTAELNVKYNPNYTYVAGLDLGRNVDYTVLSIMCLETGKEVALLRINKLSWDVIRYRVLDLLKKWKVSYLTIEINNVGSVIHETLLEELEMDEWKESLSDMVIQPITMTNILKNELANQIHADLDTNSICFQPVYDNMNLDLGYREFNNFIAEQTASGLWTYKADGNGHDDIVMARMLANRSRRYCSISWISFV